MRPDYEPENYFLIHANRLERNKISLFFLREKMDRKASGFFSDKSEEIEMKVRISHAARKSGTRKQISSPHNISRFYFRTALSKVDVLGKCPILMVNNYQICICDH